MTYKERKVILKQVFYFYKKAKILQMINSEKLDNDFLSINNEVLSCRKFLEIMEYLLNCLNSDSKKIINNEFIIFDYKCWWREYYSKATYYRLSNEIFKEFSELLSIEGKSIICFFS